MSICADNPLALLLARFERHQLADLNQANLMNRVDQKFLMPRSKLPELLKGLQPHCTLLEVESKLISLYQNTYYDTEALDFYHQHHNGKRNRLKIRTRRYAQQDLMFLEAKLKTNKGRTYKHREAVSHFDSDVLSELLQQQSLTLPAAIKAVQDCNYHRLSFAREQEAERLTIDFDLEFTDLASGERVHLPDLVIVELKQARLCVHSCFASLLRTFNLTRNNFSKYCIGTALIRPNAIKTNRFKPTLMQLEKTAGEIIYA